MQQVNAIPLAWPVNRWIPSRAVVSVTGITAIGLILRVFMLGKNSYWSDEVASILWIRNSFHFLWTTGLLTDPTPPLYYSLLKIWVALVGSEAEGPVRLLSAIASTMTIPLVFLLALEFMEGSAALLAAGLFACNPMQIYFAQEARGYALIPLLFGLSLLGLVRFSRSLNSRGLEHGSHALLLYAAGGILLIYAHAIATITLAALNLGFLCYMVRCRPAGVRLTWREMLRRALPLLLTNLFLLVVDTPLLWFDLHTHSTVAWIEKPHLMSVLGAVTSFTIDPVSPQELFRISCLLTLAFGSLLILGLIRAHAGLFIRSFLVAPPVLFLVMSILVSFFKPFFIPRATIWIPLPLCLLVAYSLHHAWHSSGHRRLLFPAALTGCVVLTIGLGWQGIYIRGARTKEDWRGLTSMLSTLSTRTDEFVVGPATNPMPMNLYGERDGRILFGTVRAPILRWAPHQVAPMLWLPQDVPEPRRLDTAGLKHDLDGSRPVWVVLGQRDWKQFGPQILGMLPEDMVSHAVDRSHSDLILITNRAHGS